MKFSVNIQWEHWKRYGRDKVATSEFKVQLVFTQLSKNKHKDQDMEQNKRQTVSCQICSKNFSTSRSARKVCSPCRGWILHIRGLYREMNQIKEMPIEVVTIEEEEEEAEIQHEPIEVVTIEDDDDDEAEIQHEPEVVTLD